MSAAARGPEPAASPEHTPAQQRARFLQQIRVRVGLQVYGATIVGVVAMAAVALQGRQWLSLVTLLGGLVLTVAGAMRVRRTRAIDGSATLLIVWSFASVIFTAATERGLAVSVSPWPPLLAFFALFMLGPRHGWLYVAVAVLQVGVSLLLHHMGWSLPLSLVSAWDADDMVISAAMGTGLLGLLGYVYESSQQRVLVEVEDALIASEHNERQLDAMFDSATAAICSIDPAGHLMLHNRAFARMATGSARAPQPGDALAGVLGPLRWARWQPHIERALAGAGPACFEELPEREDAPHHETVIQPILVHGQVTGVTVLSRDITERKRAEAELHQLHQELVRVSHQAGMAAVAGEVLHNAGNVLGSTGVAVATLERHVHELRAGELAQAVALVDEHAGALDRFVRDDPRGQHLIEVLGGLAEHFAAEQQELDRELHALQQNVVHLTRVIHAQQSHARSAGVLETISVADLVDAVLRLQAPSWAELGIAVEREIADVPALHIDRHRVMEVLINLVSNARQSLRDSGQPAPRLRIRAEPAGPDTVRIHVADNGLGIAADHREQIFRLGFTTKQNGGGIGLHSSGNIAQQLGGSLSFHSDGPGQGAVFTLALPIVPPPPVPVDDAPDRIETER
jgi:PAS domain S-box-containing protein